jgi:4-hydroxy-2-oxoheptanedioate aldolase
MKVKINKVKQRINEGHTVFGSFVFSPEASHVEILGLAGYDFVILDMEHAPMGIKEVERLVIAAEAVDITPIVRIPSRDPQMIGRILDTGAQGIMVPHLMSKADAKQIAQAVHYPPAGIRGTCSGVRATGYSSTSFDMHVQQTSKEVWVVGLIEDADAADVIEEIIADGNIDVVSAGPADLSSSLGVPGQFKHPEVMNRVKRVVEVARKSNRTVSAIYVTDPVDAEQWIRNGVRVIIYGLDFKVLYEAYHRGLERMQSLAPR